jgi:hypothetical protein
MEGAYDRQDLENSGAAGCRDLELELTHTCRMCCVVSYILALATLVENPPVRARTSVTLAA